eukprot:g42237.t1
MKEQEQSLFICSIQHIDFETLFQIFSLKENSPKFFDVSSSLKFPIPETILKENQSYSLMASASYSVIEMPYKNFSAELPTGSIVSITVVRGYHEEFSFSTSPFRYRLLRL